MRLSCASISLVLLLASPARAQDAAVSLTESEFLERYQRYEPRFGIGAADIAASQAGVAAANVWLNPSLALERESAAGSSEMFAGASLAVDLGGRGARVQAARAQVRASRARAAHRRWGLIVDAALTYWNAVRAREHVALLTASRASLAAVVELLKTRAKAGESSGYQRDRLELELIRHDTRLDEARAHERVALLRGDAAPGRVGARLRRG